MSANYQDVLAQLTGAGLIIDSLETGRMRRCKVKGDREKRGWYSLHEIQSQNGETLIVGSYGIWHGSDNGAQKVELRKAAFSAEQRESIRKRIAEDRKRADTARRIENDRAAHRAASAWARYSLDGESEYLARKGVGAYGVRFTPAGAVVIALTDVAGVVYGLQFVRTAAQAAASNRPRKEFWPAGMAKRAHFHLIGVPDRVVLVAEGYATAASLHQATGIPAVVAFDAGNIAPVCAALRKRYKTIKILICADDDSLAKCRKCEHKLSLTDHPTTCPSCDQAHERNNAGVLASSTAALEAGGAWIAPAFPDTVARWAKFVERDIKLTDFNDLAAETTAAAVRDQVLTRISALGWAITRSAAPATKPRGEGLTPIGSIGELLDRYALVYGQGGTVFDRQEHCLVALSDMRDACQARELHRAWCEHPDRDIVRVREVGFDPGCDDLDITCNLWAGWPTEPVAGRCEKLLDLLRYMCANDANPEALYQWVLRWIAYPIQHPGAKMKTTMVIHGPQGTGKNLFFEALMSIYGPYGRVIGQDAIEDRFNDWASRKLFLIADEVIARSDLYHVKNKLKAFITGEWIRINPKNLAAYDERNHVNMVFLSNEAMPVVLEEDDRRHVVIWTPEKLSHEYYRAVLDEIANGGAAALHDYLLHLDLGEFGNGQAPPVTSAKSELISLSLDSTARFYYALISGDIPGVTPCPALSSSVYELYRLWCNHTGNRAAPQQRLINAWQRHHRVVNARKRYQAGSRILGPHGVLYLGANEPPPDTTETAWLGEQISAFQAAVQDYREANK